MTGFDERDEEFDARMREALRDHAADAPQVDLTAASLTRARRIRLRRRASVGAVALAVAGIVVPVGFGLVDSDTDANLADRSDGDPTTSTGGGPSTITLADLGAGDAPAVPYLAAGELVRDGDRTPVPGAPDNPSDSSEPSVVVDAAAFDDGVAGFVINREQGSLTLRAGDSPLPSSPRTTQPAVDSNGAIAYAVKGLSGHGAQASSTSTLVYATRLAETPRYASTDQLVITQVMDVEKGVALVNAVSPSGRQLVGSADFAHTSPTAITTPYPDVVVLSAADQGMGLMAGRTTGMSKHCTAMLSTDDASQLWKSCRWRPTEFSADGSSVFALGLPLDGSPVREVGVLDASSGVVMHTFVTDGRFGRATFEDDNALDIVTVQDGQSAIVRCGSDGDCELATDPEPAHSGTLAAPYQLTANP